MKSPIDIDVLPAPLRKAVRTAIADKEWGDAIETFEEWLDGKAKRPPEVLVVLAYMMFRDAVEVMVDEVGERSEAALKLLDEAKLDTKPIKALRDAVTKARGLARAKDAKVAKSKERKLEDLDAYELRELAYKLGESKQPADLATAARAWTIAAGRVKEAYKKRDYLARAALDFATAGDWNQAKPGLDKMLERPGDYDSWLIDYALYRFLDRAANADDVADFTAQWKKALAMSQDKYFPFAEPVQNRYLEFAVEHELVEIAQHLVKIITKHQGPKKRKALAPLLDRARALLD